MGLSDAKGKVVERVEYDVYGLPTFMDADGKVLESSAVGNNILFTGREYEAEMGNYFFRARSMHPMLGRFMQKDPLLYVDGMNLISYVNNNPINWIDLDGTDDFNARDIYNKYMRQQNAVKNYPNSSSLSKSPSHTNYPKLGDLGIYNKPSHNPTYNPKLDKPFGQNVSKEYANKMAKQTGKKVEKQVAKQVGKQAVKGNPVGKYAEGAIVGIGAAIGAGYIAWKYDGNFGELYKDIVGGYIDDEYGWMLPNDTCEP